MTTDNSATQEDGAAIKNGQRVLGEVCEQLRDLAEGSNEWLETIMVAVGLFLLAIAAKAPKEMEVLGLKVDIEDVPKTFFLGILAFALLFRIVQGWVMARLSSDAIDAKFGEVREMLMALRDRLEERMAGHRHAAELAFERGRQEVQLDELTGLFDASTLLAGEDAQGVLKVFSATPDQLRREAEQLFRHRREERLARGQADWYPPALWQQASDAALNLAVAEQESITAMQAQSVVAVALGGSAAPADVVAAEEAEARVQALRTARNQAVSALSQHISEHRSQPVHSMRDEGRALNGLVAQIDRITRRARFYRYVAKVSLGFSLLVPSLAALAAAYAVLSHHAA